MTSPADLFWANDKTSPDATTAPLPTIETDPPPSFEGGGAQQPFCLANLNRLVTLLVAFGLATAMGVWFLSPRDEAKTASTSEKSVFRLANPVNLMLWMTGVEKNMDDVQKLLDESAKKMQVDMDRMGNQGMPQYQQIDVQKFLGPQFHLPQNDRPNARSQGAGRSYSGDADRE
jgi:hypothetical protein